MSVLGSLTVCHSMSIEFNDSGRPHRLHLVPHISVALRVVLRNSVVCWLRPPFPDMHIRLADCRIQLTM